MPDDPITAQLRVLNQPKSSDIADLLRKIMTEVEQKGAAAQKWARPHEIGVVNRLPVIGQRVGGFAGGMAGALGGEAISPFGGGAFGAPVGRVLGAAGGGVLGEDARRRILPLFGEQSPNADQSQSQLAVDSAISGGLGNGTFVGPIIGTAYAWGRGAAGRNRTQVDPDPYPPGRWAVAQAKKKYPILSKLPLLMTTGSGPYESETYEPTDTTNPYPGKWNIQLRSEQSMRDQSLLPDTVASEGLHALYALDPRYRAATKAFGASMTQDQLDASRKMYEREKAQNNDIGSESFEEWLPRVQAQEYIRGYLFPNVNPGWTGPKGEGQYTVQQMQLLDQLKNYLQTPAQ